MLITKFNRMVRSRLLWGGFAFLIAFAFVGSSLVNRGGCSGDPNAANASGILFDTPVPHREYLNARYFELGMRDPSDVTEEGEEILHRQTWSRLAALHLAGKMGLTATDAELAEMIRRDPAFAVGGVFNRDQYRSTVQQRLGVPVSTFEAYSRQDLVMRKIADILGSASWISPSELNYRLRNFTDLYTVRLATVANDDLEAKAKLTDDEVAAYYESHRDDFMEPDQMRVRYVAFPIAPESATSTVAEVDLEDYYDDHIEDFTSTDTNGTDTTLPLTDEGVRAQVLAAVSREKAVFAARDAATDLVMRLAPDRAGQAPGFDAAAASVGLTVATSDYFSATEAVPGLDVGAEFNTWAFRLDPDDPEAYFSDALTGSNSVYVIATADKRAARVPELAEIADRVRLAAETAAQENLLQEKAGELHDKLVAKMTEKKTPFEETAANLHLNVSTAMTFSVYGLIEDGSTERTDPLIDTVPSLQVGQISAPVAVSNGWMIVELSDRRPGAPASLSLLKSELQSAYDQYRTRLTLRDWREYALKQGNLQDRMRGEGATDQAPPPAGGNLLFDEF